MRNGHTQNIWIISNHWPFLSILLPPAYTAPHIHYLRGPNGFSYLENGGEEVDDSRSPLSKIDLEKDVLVQR